MKRQIIQEFIDEAKSHNMESPQEYLIVDIVKASLGMGVEMKSSNSMLES